MNIMKRLASAGCSDGFPYVLTPIKTTANTGRRIIIPKNQRFWHRLKKSTAVTTGLMVAEA